ncbi:hypothetical protein V1511DRAFT_510753 [Dipodascopsis uninucleata]
MSVPTLDNTFERVEVENIISRRSNCVLKEFVQFSCDFPRSIDEIPECRPFIRYFAMCRDAKGLEKSAEITPISTFSSLPLEVSSPFPES